MPNKISTSKFGANCVDAAIEAFHLLICRFVGIFVVSQMLVTNSEYRMSTAHTQAAAKGPINCIPV